MQRFPANQPVAPQRGDRPAVGGVIEPSALLLWLAGTIERRRLAFDGAPAVIKRILQEVARLFGVTHHSAQEAIQLPLVPLDQLREVGEGERLQRSGRVQRWIRHGRFPQYPWREHAFPSSYAVPHEEGETGQDEDSVPAARAIAWMASLSTPGKPACGHSSGGLWLWHRARSRSAWRSAPGRTRRLHRCAPPRAGRFHS